MPPPSNARGQRFGGANYKKARGTWLHQSPFPSLNPLLPTSYLTYLFSLLLPPASSPEPTLEAFYDPLTQSVQVTDLASVLQLWQSGFYGKGNLSRSEPTWWVREQNRRGANLNYAPEEITALRRKARIVAKQAKAEGKVTNARVTVTASNAGRDGVAKPWSDPENAEHLQLDPQETFFLLFALGTLRLWNATSPPSPQASPMTIQQAWRLFSDPSTRDDEFKIQYAVYHHYRSLGWVARSGLKFSVDWVLYKGSTGDPEDRRGVGPVGGHAEFSVLVRRRYEDEAEDVQHQAEQRDWPWLSTVSRVTSGVKKVRFFFFPARKLAEAYVSLGGTSSPGPPFLFAFQTLIIAYVTVPSAKRCPPSALETPACLQLYQVHEVCVRRFLAARVRD